MYRNVVITERSLMDSLSNGIYVCMLGENADRTTDKALDNHLLSMDFMTENISLEEYCWRAVQLRYDTEHAKKA
jgi:hypothetical protein